MRKRKRKEKKSHRENIVSFSVLKHVEKEEKEEEEGKGRKKKACGRKEGRKEEDE